MNSKNLNIGILLLLTFYWNCERNPITLNLDKLKVISGQVTLENQRNHGSCFVWVDSLWIGTVTDSSGYFEILIPDSLDASGIFTLYYHIECFDWAQQKFEMLHGKVVPDHHDVDKTGHFKPVLLKELARITLTTDRTTYSASGDTIHFTIYVQNLSEKEINFGLSGLALDHIAAETSTFYWIFHYLFGPRDIWVTAGGSATQDGYLILPLQEQTFLSFPDIPNGIIPPGNYFFIILSIISSIPYEAYDHMIYKQNLFFYKSSYLWPKGFILSWRPFFNIYDSKNIFYSQITIIP